MMKKTILVFALALCVFGCDRQSQKEEAEGAKPPPIQSSRAGVCNNGGGKVDDKVTASFIPQIAGDYCVDPHGETRAYGEKAPGTLDEVCTELFDGECEVYKSFGLERVVTLRFVDGRGSPGSVNLNLSRFSSNDGAYGFYTKRVVSEADPLVQAPAVLEAGAAAALGTGIAYVYRGNYVAELSYTNELESPDQLRKSSSQVLPVLAKVLGGKLSGPLGLPESAERLPDDQLLAHGIVYQPKDLLDIGGLGPGAVGFYKDGPVRYRIFVSVSPREDSAQQIIKTLSSLDGASELKKLGFEAVRFKLAFQDDGPQQQWVAGRRGPVVWGVGDESYAKKGDPALSDQDKLLFLRKLVLGELHEKDHDASKEISAEGKPAAVDAKADRDRAVENKPPKD